MLSAGQVTELARAAVRRKVESEYVEFKQNLFDPDQIARTVSAMSNVAAMNGEQRGLIIWGVHDETREVIGTSFRPDHQKVGNEDFLPWLVRSVGSLIEPQFHEIEIDDHRIAVLVVPRTYDQPVRFKGDSYIRVGSYNKALKDNPALEKRFWGSLIAVSFEQRIARADVRPDDVFTLLKVDTFLSLIKMPSATSNADALQQLRQAKMIEEVTPRSWNITNLGALCLAARLDEFESVQRKAVRFVKYAATTKDSATDAIDGTKGYAVGFEGLLSYISGQLPRREITDPIRRTVEHFPPKAVRELVANALIHQDLSVTGAGPLVELFSDRLEISNPGAPLGDPDRLLDSPAVSRNEQLAGFMRRVGICEERGSGIDIAAIEAELHQLPAPEFRVASGHTVATLLGPRNLAAMAQSERVWSTYLHSCLRQVTGQVTTNSTIRERFGLSDTQAPKASKLLGEALEEKMIRVKDPTAGKRSTSYVPYWA